MELRRRGEIIKSTFDFISKSIYKRVIDRIQMNKIKKRSENRMIDSLVTNKESKLEVGERKKRGEDWKRIFSFFFFRKNATL